MRKVWLLTFLIVAVALYGSTAWCVQDYSYSVSDDAEDTATDDCTFSNGFDILSATGIASDNNDAISVSLTVNGIVGNGNQSVGFSSLIDAALCSDTDPMVDCGEGDGCPYQDAPDTASAESESYRITICQPGSSNPSADGCPGGVGLVTVEYRPAITSGNNVSVISGGAGLSVTPTNIDASTLTNSFTLTIHGLGTSGFSYIQPWGIQLFANAQFDGPGEDLAGAQVTPPAPPQLTCSKSLNLSTVEPGDVVTATVTVTNSGASDTTVQILDTLDSGLSYVSGSANIGEPTISSQNLTWSGYNVPAGGSLVLTYLISVDTIAEGATLCNSVVVTSLEFSGVVPGDCSACVSRDVTPPPPYVPVPGLTELGVSITALLMVLATAFYLRRRRMHG